MLIKKKISELKPHPKNPRKHDERNVEAVKKSLIEYGQTKPVVINKQGFILAGHGVVMSAKELGWDEIDVVVCDLPKEKELAYLVADNRTTDLSEFDDEVLADIFKQCDNVEMPGYSQEEMDEIIQTIFDANIEYDEADDEIPGKTPKKENQETAEDYYVAVVFESSAECDEFVRRLGYPPDTRYVKGADIMPYLNQESQKQAEPMDGSAQDQ